MPQYDFHQLTWYELELLGRDLVQAELEVFLESFKNGRDGGQDFRHAVTKEKIVGQVKHYLGSGFSKLLSKLREEAPKIIALNPSRYILITSVKLNPTDKDKIIEVIGAKYLKSGDIIGQDELNNLLGKHPEIEKQHYKLWLASTAVLERVLHNAEITNTEFKVRQIYAEAKRYVSSAAFPETLKKLNDHKVAVIAGPPGIGKTTLANLVLYQHIERGYQAVIIQRDIKEGLDLYKHDTKQIFYFDDFMGATFLGDNSNSPSGSDDKVLIDFIKLIGSSPNSRLIMTTREHIYSLAMGRSERLRESEIDGRRVILHMPSYSNAQRAKILYNHLHFSDLPPAYKRALLQDNFYLQIIRHKKFNPRLIQWLSNHQKFKHVKVEDYRKHVSDLLDDPSEIWRHAYEQELSHAGRSLLLTLFSLKGNTLKSRLETRFGHLHRARSQRYGFETKPNDFGDAFQELRGAFIKSGQHNTVKVIDPSILDLMNSVVRRAPQNALDIINNAVSFDQVQAIWEFAKSQKSQDVLATISSNINQLIPTIHAGLVENRRFVRPDGTVIYFGSGYEKRLSFACNMAKTIKSGLWKDVTLSVFDRLMTEWATERAHIDDALEAQTSLVHHPNFTHDEVEALRDQISLGILADISRHGCRSDELCSVIRQYDDDDFTQSHIQQSFAAAFQNYSADYFQNEVRECRNPDEYDALIADLEIIGEDLSVSVKQMVQNITDEKEGFLENYDEMADYDEYKEQRYMQRAEDSGIADMFGSLTQDE